MVASALSVVVAASALAGCGGTQIPRPSFVQVTAADYVAVPFAPRTPPVETVPKRPAQAGNLVWVDGGWRWDGDRYRWKAGAWVVAPAGIKLARWVLVRRPADGQLFFAASSWRDDKGNEVDAPPSVGSAAARPNGPRTDLDELR